VRLSTRPSIRSPLGCQRKVCEPLVREGGANSAFPVYSVQKGRFHVAAESLSLSLGNFAWFWLISLGARLIRERKIWGTSPLQHFPLSPPEEEWGQRA
jgi:hypothetical protein